jgi:hypothetical protein
LRGAFGRMSGDQELRRPVPPAPFHVHVIVIHVGGGGYASRCTGQSPSFNAAHYTSISCITI